MEHIDIRKVLSDETFIGKEVVVCGWVRTARDSKNMAFLELNDGTSFRHLQIVVDKSVLTPPESAFHLGASLRVAGTAVANRDRTGVELNAAEISLIGDWPGDYPIQKQYHKLETLREMPHLRVRTNTFHAVFQVRSVMAAALHRFFQER